MRAAPGHGERRVPFTKMLACAEAGTAEARISENTETAIRRVFMNIPMRLLASVCTPVVSHNSVDGNRALLAFNRLIVHRLHIEDRRPVISRPALTITSLSLCYKAPDMTRRPPIFWWLVGVVAVSFAVDGCHAGSEHLRHLPRQTLAPSLAACSSGIRFSPEAKTPRAQPATIRSLRMPTAGICPSARDRPDWALDGSMCPTDASRVSNATLRRF